MFLRRRKKGEGERFRVKAIVTLGSQVSKAATVLVRLNQMLLIRGQKDLVYSSPQIPLGTFTEGGTISPGQR